MKDTKNPLFNKAPSQATLTPKQKMVLDFITESTAKKGYAPSQQEIAKHFGFNSLGTVQNYLVRLERQGVLAKTWNAKRSLQALTPPPAPSLSSRPERGLTKGRAAEFEGLELPLLGKVAAGRPLEATTSGESLAVPPTMMKPGDDLFALQVKGDSMIEDGILDGDYVIIRKQSQADNGQTVVAMINNEATIKRYYRKKSHIELHPANSQLKPIVVNESEPLRIEGVLVGVIRHYKA